jgi:hypothetical protein
LETSWGAASVAEVKDLRFRAVLNDPTTHAKIGLVLGLLLVLGGIFGIWLQGPFYGGYWDFIVKQDLVFSFVLPAAVTTAGCLLLAPVILCSPLTSRWTAERRNLTYVVFFAVVIVLIGVAGAIAAAGVEKTSY